MMMVEVCGIRGLDLEGGVTVVVRPWKQGTAAAGFKCPSHTRYHLQTHRSVASLRYLRLYLSK